MPQKRIHRFLAQALFGMVGLYAAGWLYNQGDSVPVRTTDVTNTVAPTSETPDGAVRAGSPVQEEGEAVASDEVYDTASASELWVTREIEELASCRHEIMVSKPILFRSGMADPVASHTGVVAAFLETPRLGDGDVALHVFGFASADGSAAYNMELSRRRAKAVRTKIERLVDRWPTSRRPSVGGLHALGENHLTNGVAASRSARIVACLAPSDAARTESE